MSNPNIATVKRMGQLGRVGIPREIRDALGLEIGTPISIELEDDMIIIRRMVSEEQMAPHKLKEFEDTCAQLYDDAIARRITKKQFIDIAVGKI